MVIILGSTNALASAPLDEDARFTMGSPKRYAWDDRTVGGDGSNYWSQIQVNKLHFPVDRFISKNSTECFGCLWIRGQGLEFVCYAQEDDLVHAPFRDSPQFSETRFDIWFALSIIEAAYRQINSENYLEVAKRRTLPRKLSKISVLYPSGWTKIEKNAYFKQWKRALKIFSLSHLGFNSVASVIR